MTETTGGQARSAAEIMGTRQPDSITQSTVTMPSPFKVEIEHKISFATAWFTGIGLAGGVTTAISIFQIASHVTKGLF
jgi:hypothetical protein